MNVQQTLALGFQQLEHGNLATARQMFDEVLKTEPQNFAALNGRGFIAFQLNQLHLSAADFQLSLSVNPKQIFAQKMSGIVLGALGRFDDAMQAFDAAISIDRRDPEIYFNRSNFRYQAGQSELALKDLDEAINLKSSYLEARSNRASLLISQEAFAAAERDLEYLTDKIKNNPDFWVALGLVRNKLGKNKEALQANERALNLNSQHPDAMLNNSSIAFDMQNFLLAVEWAERAIGITPNRSEVHYSLAKALFELSNFEGALGAYDRAIELNTHYAEAFMGRGLVNAALRRTAAADADYDRAIQLRPNYEDAIYNRSYMHLEQHNFVEGWQGYECRLGFPKFKDALLTDFPIWHGEPHVGRLLVRGEQGLGDQIIFASVLPELLKQVPNVCLQLEPRLVTLFQRSFPGVEVMSLDKKPPADVAAQICIGSLPQYFRKDAASFAGATIPFLKADPEKTAAFRKALAPHGERIIGLNWRSFRNKYANEKSVDLLDFAPFFHLPGYTVVNLQYGDVKDEVRAAEAAGLRFNKAVTIDLTKDIDGIASLVDACDVLVSSSNTTVHIAGALNKPVMLMLPYRTGKLWYWSEAKGEGSLWYPSIKTFHQSAQGDWAGTIEKIVNCLQQSVGSLES